MTTRRQWPLFWSIRPMRGELLYDRAEELGAVGQVIEKILMGGMFLIDLAERILSVSGRACHR